MGNCHPVLVTGSGLAAFKDRPDPVFDGVTMHSCRVTGEEAEDYTLSEGLDHGLLAGVG